MTVDQLLAELAARFPNAPLKAWAPEFRRELSGLAPDTLRRAFDACLGEWTEAYAPKPAHVLQAVRPLLQAREDEVVRAQLARREESERLARDKADPIKRAELDRKFKAAMAHLSSASPAKTKTTTIFKALPSEWIERIRKDHGQ